MHKSTLPYSDHHDWSIAPLSNPNLRNADLVIHLEDQILKRKLLVWCKNAIYWYGPDMTQDYWLLSMVEKPSGKNTIVGEFEPSPAIRFLGQGPGMQKAEG